MKSTEFLEEGPNEHDAELAKIAQRCMMTVLDHSRASKIRLMPDGATESAILEVPPQAVRLLSEILGFMADRRPVTVIPHDHELSTQEVANFLCVSRPFVIKQIENGKIKCRKIGSHRRIEFVEALRFKEGMKCASAAALDELSKIDESLGLDY